MHGPEERRNKGKQVKGSCSQKRSEWLGSKEGERFTFYSNLSVPVCESLWLFKKMLFILFLEGKGGRKRGRETSMRGCLSCTPNWGPGPQPRQGKGKSGRQSRERG